MTLPAASFLQGADPELFDAADRCWCGLKAEKPSPLSADYFLCSRCGTHFARARLRPEAVAKFYSLEGYWHNRQRGKNHPTLWERPPAFERDGRVGKWLGILDNHISTAGAVVEIGCAEGTLLQQLRERGWQTTGVEPDPETARSVSEKTGLTIRGGVFPQIEIPPCDLLVACDVLEHAADPRAFVLAAAQALRPEGVLFLQLPLVEAEQPDFGHMNEKVFDWCEHAFIFSRDSLGWLLESCGFSILENSDAWSRAHEIVVARKRPVFQRQRRLLANLGDMFAPEWTGFVDELNAFAAPLGLRTLTTWSKVWEYPAIWHGGIKQLPLAGLRVLDIGSELSPLPWYLATQGAEVVLVERTPDFIPHWVFVRNQLGNPSVDWRVVQTAGLPFDPNSFDLVTSLSVIEHQENKTQAVDEVARVLRPGGVFALSFDICEPDLGMTFPEWNGRALTRMEFEALIWKHPAFSQRHPPAWNQEDIPAFLAWHRQTAPHHNYISGAAVLRKPRGLFEKIRFLLAGR